MAEPLLPLPGITAGCWPVAGSCRTAAWSHPHGGAPSQRGLKIPAGSGREDLGVHPFPSSARPFSLPMLAGCGSALCGAGVSARNAMQLCCPRKPGELTEMLVAGGFPLVLSQLGSHRKRGCQNSPSLTYRWQPRCGARERGDSILPAPPWLGGGPTTSPGQGSPVG